MWNVLGHDRTVRLLQRALERNTMPHALLFVGPSGIGKTHLARELAKALNCVGEDSPCQRCVHCRQIDADSHPDVTLVERPDGKESIAILQVRELRETSSLRPFQGKQKVYVIAGAESLTAQAADALLKTLEEPQRQVTIVLTALDSSALPETIVSRCRVMALQPVETPQLVEALKARKLEQTTAENIARLAQGNVGWALQAAKQP